MIATPHLCDQIDARPLGPRLAESKTTALLRTEHLELIRIVVPQGKEIPSHSARGEILLQCLEGRLEFTVLDQRLELTPGQIVWLSADQLHAVKGLEDSSALLTILLLPKCKFRPLDVVQEASEDSFPASDAPSRTPIMGP